MTQPDTKNEQDCAMDGIGDSPAERKPRKHFSCVALMANDRLSPRQVTINDISEQGVGAHSPAGPPEVGEEVTLTTPGEDNPLTGTVCWVRGDCFGLKIDGSIRTDLFELNYRSRETALGSNTSKSESELAENSSPRSSGPMRPC